MLPWYQNFLGSQQTCNNKIMAEKKKKNLTCMTLLCMIALRNKTVAHIFLLSFNNANGHLCQERFLRSRNFATMVT